MIDVDLIHEHRVIKKAREKSKHTIERIWLSSYIPQTGSHAKTYMSDSCRIVAF